MPEGETHRFGTQFTENCHTKTKTKTGRNIRVYTIRSIITFRKLLQAVFKYFGSDSPSFHPKF